MTAYSWGANSHGQLGLGFASELCVTPQKVVRTSFDPCNARFITGGGGHVLVLDTGGLVHSCGWNNRGQLGVDCTDDRNEFITIPSDYFNNATVERVACGWDVSAAITSNKELYLWGSNSFQQLGVCSRGFGSIRRPMRFRLPRNEIPRQISFGLRHCCILSDTNLVYLLGKIKITTLHPDLKVCSMSHNNVTITRISAEFKIETVVSGQNHFYLVASEGCRIVGVGENRFGQSNCFEVETKIKKAVAGWTHNGILTASKEIFLWGRNSYGQLGCPATESIPYPSKLYIAGNKTPKQLHLGAEHGLVVTEDRKVCTWGWNEHGNCGNGSVNNLYSASELVLPAACKLAGTGAGFCYAICEES